MGILRISRQFYGLVKAARKLIAPAEEGWVQSRGV